MGACAVSLGFIRRSGMSIANGTSGFPARRVKAKGKIVPSIPESG
jgi:hypothetical protein